MSVFLGRVTVGGPHFSARLDAELIGDPALVGAECQVGHDQAGLALADDLVEVEVSPFALGGEGVVTRLAKLHRDGVVIAGFGQKLHCIGAGPGNMRGADNGVFDTIANHLARGFICGFGDRSGLI